MRITAGATALIVTPNVAHSFAHQVSVSEGSGNAGSSRGRSGKFKADTSRRINVDKAEGVFKKTPDRDEFAADINESLIVELYSR